MRLWGYLLVCFSGLITLATAGVDPGHAEMIERMKAGRHILMIRHALAPGTGDPANFRIGDCSTQRNLDDRGRKQAKAIGDWLRSNGITSARVYSSQWCRCLETAKLLEYEMTQDREPNLRALRTFMAQQPSDGALIILVTHFVTISAVSNEAVSSGEGVLLELNEDAPYEVVGRLNFGNK
jgi:broad specificity phosphatase PhoE